MQDLPEINSIYKCIYHRYEYIVLYYFTDIQSRELLVKIHWLAPTNWSISSTLATAIYTESFKKDTFQRMATELTMAML